MFVNALAQDYISNKIISRKLDNIENRFKSKDKQILERYSNIFFKKKKPLSLFNKDYLIKKEVLESILKYGLLDNKP